MSSKILILDFGSQYTQLIARRIREAKVFCEIEPFDYPLEKIRAARPQGIILSGGPASVLDPQGPQRGVDLLECGLPVLGICYGLQLIGHVLGGKVQASEQREYGRTDIEICAKTHDGGILFDGIDSKKLTVWMSHGDKIVALPPGFQVAARSTNAEVVALADPKRNIYGLQFHPEVSHTDQGVKIIENFLFKVCGVKPDWLMTSFLDQSIARIREQAQDDGVICATSGGVDSTVTAVMLHRAVGTKLRCFFIDNGLLRKDEASKVSKMLGENFKVPLKTVDASERFLKRLRGVTDPEQKRKIIGNVFIEVFEAEARAIPGVKYLAQGTLYPDVIESKSFRGPSAVIKSHHNVGGLPEKMGLKLIEPLRELFKDEVREMGKALGLPDELIHRQPFPGPGLAIRVLGEVTPERLAILREVDEIVVGEIKKAGYYYKVWQSFAVLLPVKTVGVMGDERSYENVAALRVVSSRDGMTADWVRLPDDLLARISSRVINEVRGVNRVVYDISSKPPATIEWE